MMLVGASVAGAEEREAGDCSRGMDEGGGGSQG